MVTLWGGFIFVLNMIGLHALVLVLLGRFSTKVYLSYSIFYVIGTILATHVPVVGMTPLKSLEQLGPFGVFVVYQLLQHCESTIKSKQLHKVDSWKYRIKVFATAFILSSLAVTLIIPKGYFGPISSRVRGLFVRHTKTGNPLVDSVAEHQPADPSSYFRYLQHLCTFAPIGFIFSLFYFGDASSFVISYAILAYFLSQRMVRLILLMGPVASILGGIGIGRIATWSFFQLWIEEEEESKDSEPTRNVSTDMKKKKKVGKRGNVTKGIQSPIRILMNTINSKDGTMFKRLVAAVLVFILSLFAASFQDYSLKMSRALSNPTITMIGQRSDGSLVKIDDYREAYW